MLLALGGAAMAGLRMLSPTSLQEELAAARREGLPTEPQSLQDAPISRELNGAEPYIRAVAHAGGVIDKTSWQSNLDAIVRPAHKQRRMATLTKSERKRVRVLIAVLEPAFAELREAVRRPGFAMRRNWDEGLNVDLSDTRLMKAMIRNLALRAELRQAEGDLDLAFADFQLAAGATSILCHGKTPYQASMRAAGQKQVFWA